VVEEGEFAKHGKVTAEDGRIVFEPAGRGTAIAWTGDFPTADYELVWEAVRLSGRGDFSGLVFPVGANACNLIVGGYGGVVALEHLDGRWGKDNLTTTPKAFENGRWYRIRLRVIEHRIQVWVDDDKLIDLATRGHKLSLHPWYQPLKPFGLWLWNTRAAFRNIRLRRLKSFIQSEEGPWEVYLKWPFDAAEARRRQEETAKALGVPVEQEIDLGDGVKMTLVLIPAGEFLMGSPPTTSPEKLQKLYGGDIESYQMEFPQHRVRISKPFLLGKREVNQALWRAVMGDNPSEAKATLQHPAERVSWQDCQVFLRKLSEKTGRPFRLPTEAEWEYACRAGSASDYCFGNDTTLLGHYSSATRRTWIIG